MKRASSVVTIAGIIGLVVTAVSAITACGSTAPEAAGPEVACESTLAAFCAARGGCHETEATWSTPTTSDPRARSGPDGTCNGLTYFTAPVGADQSDHFYYDSSGKLVGVGGWESAAPCSGSCRYTCVAGPGRFDPCAVPVDQRKSPI